MDYAKKQRDQRSAKQNKSLHVYLELVANGLADAGYDMKKVVKLPIRPTKENVKETMFKPYMNALFPDKESTTELDTLQMQQVYEAFNSAIAEKFGVSYDWPHEDRG